jgi:predicted component of type VI protein secretion system
LQSFAVGFTVGVGIGTKFWEVNHKFVICFGPLNNNTVVSVHGDWVLLEKYGRSDLEEFSKLINLL